MFLRYGLYHRAIEFAQALKTPMAPIARHLAERVMQLQSSVLSQQMQRKAIVAGDFVQDQTDPVAIGWALLYSIIVLQKFKFGKGESAIDVRKEVIEAMLLVDSSKQIPQWLRMIQKEEGVLRIWHHCENLCRLLLRFNQPQKALLYFKETMDYAKVVLRFTDRASLHTDGLK